jgi:hypothetical protein
MQVSFGCNRRNDPAAVVHVLYIIILQEHAQALALDSIYSMYNYLACFCGCCLLQVLFFFLKGESSFLCMD